MGGESATEIRYSTCALDCPDACSLVVTIRGHQAIQLRGDPQHPITRGFLCAKVTRYLERVYSPQRLLHPQRRIGKKGEGRFVRIGWDEALEEIAARLKAISAAFGPESILPYSYGGTMGLLNGSGMDRRFFHRLGASRLDRTICAAAGTEALNRVLGARYGADPEQFRHARLIIAWGANILATNVHLWPFLVEARRNGARFYVIDPVRTRTARLADRHFAIRPGTDLALALGMMQVILAEGLEDNDYIRRCTQGIDGLRKLAAQYPPERVAALTGLSEEEVTTLARDYASLAPAVIRLNYGVQRSERGGSAVRAIAMLPALTGAWRRPGGGLLLSTSSAFALNRQGLEMPELQWRSPLGREARQVNMSQLGEALTTLNHPPVKALFVYNSNPAAVAPDQNAVLQGLRREDLFCVVAEQFQTDTADYADILLPATTFLEHKDLYYAYGHYELQLADAVIAPLGEAKPNVEIFRLLARKMGFQEPCFEDSEDDMIDTLLASGHPFLKGISRERLQREHSVRLSLPGQGGVFLPFADGAFPTASGKCELEAKGLEYTPPLESRDGDPRLRQLYPLELISQKNDDSMNSTFGYRAELHRATSRLFLNECDAAPRGIRTGDRVRVYNSRGSCLLEAVVNGDVRPGVVSAPSTRWSKLAEDRCNVNTLTSQRLTDLGGGATFYSCLVEVERCGD